MPITPQIQLQNLVFSNVDGFFSVQWTVDARKLRGSDKQVVSPPFEVPVQAGGSSMTFKMVICPKSMSDKSGASFKKSNGIGHVQLKCESELSDMAVASTSFSISIGQGRKAQAPRGPYPHNFLSSAMCGLPKEHADWHFLSAVDRASLTCAINVDIAPLA